MAQENQNLGVLIPIKEKNGQKAVNARDLHSFLESKQQFADWIKSRINQYGFVENQDYQILASDFYEASWGGNNKVEYALSIDMAKELSMVERTERGKQARRYFIACEKAVGEIAKISQANKPKREPSLTTKVRVGLEWVKGVSEILNLNDSSKLLLLGKVAKPLELPLPDYTPSKGVLKSASELLKERGLQVSCREFNARAIENGFLCELERKAKFGTKKFKSITKKGLFYGENQVSPNNPNSTQPHWYADKFGELLTLVGINVEGGLFNGN